MSHPRTLVFLAIITAVVPAASAGSRAYAQVPADARVAAVRAILADVTTPDRPGLAVAVVRNGEVRFSGGHGLASLEHGAPITSATAFDLASVSKQFTGLAVAMLVEEGAIRMDDDIRGYIPEMPDLGNTITIGHLVHHTSGLRDWVGALAIGGWDMHDVISFRQILRMAYGQQALNFEPGSEYSYSNTGYVLLAELVARVTGQSFRTWTDEHIFTPLGMDRTNFRNDYSEVVPDRAYGYWLAADGSSRHTIPNTTSALGSSSAFSTVEDMTRWLIDLDQPVVGAPAASLMRTAGRLNDGATIPYAFGIAHGEYRGTPTLSHSGGWAWFGTYLVHFPEQRLGVVVLSNSANIDVARAAYRIADVFLDEDLPASPAGEPARPVPVALTATLLDDFIGMYRLPGMFVRVRREGDTLRVRATGEDEFPMAPISEHEFWVDAYNAALVFERDDDGRVTRFTLRGTPAPRLDDRAPPSAAELAALVGEYVSEELKTFYEVVLEDGTPTMWHRRHGPIRLTHVWGDAFSGSRWFMGSVEFERDDAGRVVGFRVDAGDRTRNVRFVKR